MDTFDCGISQLWFDGTDVKSTAIGLLSLKHQISPIILDKTLPSRIYKQYVRGYSSIFSPSRNYSIRGTTKEELLYHPEKLKESDDVIKNTNKYLFITEEKEERVTGLMKIIFNNKYKRIISYQESENQDWLRDYRKDNRTSLNRSKLFAAIKGPKYYKPLDINNIKSIPRMDIGVLNFNLVNNKDYPLFVQLRSKELNWIKTTNGLRVVLTPDIMDKLNSFVMKLYAETSRAISGVSYSGGNININSDIISAYMTKREKYPNEIFVRVKSPELISGMSTITSYNDCFNLSIKVNICFCPNNRRQPWSVNYDLIEITPIEN